MSFIFMLQLWKNGGSMYQLYRKTDKSQEPFFVMNSDVICPDPKEQNGTSQEALCQD